MIKGPYGIKYQEQAKLHQKDDITPVFADCENCGETVEEDTLQEARLTDSRLNLFICESCQEDLENFTLVL